MTVARLSEVCTVTDGVFGGSVVVQGLAARVTTPVAVAVEGPCVDAALMGMMIAGTPITAVMGKICRTLSMLETKGLQFKVTSAIDLDTIYGSLSKGTRCPFFG